MLKSISWLTLLLMLCSGCGKEVFPAGRLQQPKGDFSYITPEGWFRTRLAGIDYIIVSTNADAGIKPNIFIEDIVPGTKLCCETDQIIEENKEQLREFVIGDQSCFTTRSGLRGIKINARHKTKQALLLATFRYLIQDADRVISITGTCAESVKSKYEPFFDSAIESLQSERGSQ